MRPKPLVIAIVIVILLIASGAAFFLFGHPATPKGDAGTFAWSPSSFLVTLPGLPGAAVFAEGSFTPTTSPARSALYADPLSALVQKGVLRSFDPDDNRVVVPQTGTVITHVTDPQQIPNTRFIAVRRANDIAVCSYDGACQMLYSFGRAIHGAVPYAVGLGTFAILNPLSGDLQGFTLDVSGAVPRLSLVRAIAPPYPLATVGSLTFDMRVPGRLMFARATAEKPKTIDMVVPPGQPGAGQKIPQTIPVTLVSVCGFDGLFSKDGPASEGATLCATHELNGSFSSPLIVPYE
jgi:hypothetical protein